MKKLFLTVILAATWAFYVAANGYDVIVAGAGTGGFGAAIQAARMGCNVLLTEETDWIGGQMTAAGVCTMDEGTPNIRKHGIYKEFCEKAVKYYEPKGESVNTCYFNVQNIAVEPVVGQKLLYEMINEVNKAKKGHIDVLLNTTVAEVYREGNKVNGVKLNVGLPGKRKAKEFTCRILIDATEYGDVIPLTGAKYRLAKYVSGNINLDAKVQDFTWTAIVKEYKNGIPEELKIKQAPAGYDKYIRHLSYIKNYANDGYNVYANPTSWNSVAHYRGLPNSETSGIDEYVTKTELNIAQNDVPVTARDIEDPKSRWKKEVEFRVKTLSLIYYMQNELGLNWSVAPFEKYDTPYNKWITKRMVEDFPELKPYENVLSHFPVMPYVRESRRIVGLHTLISSEIDRSKGPVPFIDAISINDYPEDLHGSKRPVDMDIDIDPGGNTAAEAHDWDERTGEFQVPFRSFIPEEIDGFLAAEKNISQSRLVNGATRLQPSTMLNGQAVGNIAALAVKYGLEPRQIPPVLVQWEQLNAGAPLHTKFINDLIIGTETWKAAQLCLVHGILKMDGNRFYPQDPIEKENFLTLIRSKMIGISLPDGVITKADAALLIKEYLLESAKRELQSKNRVF
jgi:hypothetical protein